MIDLSGAAFLWIKAFHIVFVIAWMAGLLYLPRLYTYHAKEDPDSAASQTFKIMERRLLRVIMNPALTITVVLGGLLAANLSAEAWVSAWLWLKAAGVIGLVVVHGLLARWRRDFAADRNSRGERFYRAFNEVPTVLMIVIVIAVVVVRSL